MPGPGSQLRNDAIRVCAQDSLPEKLTWTHPAGSHEDLIYLEADEGAGTERDRYPFMPPPLPRPVLLPMNLLPMNLLHRQVSGPDEYTWVSCPGEV